jgi:hypothetical protein
MFRPPFSSSRREGRFGNAKDGTVVPGKTIEVRGDPPELNQKFAVRSIGIGDKLTSLALDQRTRTLFASKVESGYKIIMGTVYGTDLGVWEGEVPTRWDQILPPDNFQLGDALPPLPQGIGWVELVPGSGSSGASSPRALNTEEELADIPGRTFNTTPPRLVCAYIDPSNFSHIKLVFDSNVQGFYTTQSSDAQTFLFVDSNFSAASPIQIVGFQIDPDFNNVVRLFMSRAAIAIYSEEIGITLGGGFVRGNSVFNNPQERMMVFYRRPKNVLVLVAGMEEGLSVGSKVLVVRTDFVHDSGDQSFLTSVQRVSLVLAAGGGGGGGQTAMLASVLGGNVSPTTFNASADPNNTNANMDEQGYLLTAYPSVRPFSFPLPMLLRESLVTRPRVKDWSRFDLSDDYRIGDQLPRLPDGLCYLRLERPSQVGGFSWDSFVEESAAPARADGTPPSPVDARLSLDRSKIYVYFDREGQRSRITGLSSTYTITIRDANGALLLARPGRNVSWISQAALNESKQRVELTLVRALPPNTVSSIVILVANQALLSKDVPPKASVSGTLSVLLTGDRFTVVYGMNRNGLQGYGLGDYVSFDSRAVSLSDELGESRLVYDILTSVNPPQSPHSHLDFGGGPTGGGRILAWGTNRQAQT